MDGQQPSTNPINPQLAELLAPPTPFPAFSNADLNDWVLKQAHSGTNKDFSSQRQNKLLAQEYAEVQSKLQNSAKVLESSSDLDVHPIIHRMINTHPLIQHLTFPIPKFILDLGAQRVLQSLAPYNSKIEELNRSITTRRNTLTTVRNKFDQLNDLSDEDYALLEHSHEQDKICTDIFTSCREVVQSNQPRELMFLSPKGPHAIMIEVHIAQSILTFGLYYTARSAVEPVSRSDFDEEIALNSNHIRTLENEKKEIEEMIQNVKKGDFSIISPDFNPYANVDRKTVAAMLNGIQSVECFDNIVKYYPLPSVDIEGNPVGDSSPIHLIVRAAALNRGYGYFFQVAPQSDPTINQPTQGAKPRVKLDIDHVLFEPVYDGARLQPLPYPLPNKPIHAIRSESLPQLQPQNNFDLALAYHNALNTNKNVKPDTSNWFTSPLDYPFNARQNQKRPLTSLEQYKQNMGQQPMTEPQDDYAFADYTFKVSPGDKFTTTADSGGIATHNDQSHITFIQQILATLQPHSTHYTVRLYFHQVRSTIDQIVGAYNQIKRQQPANNTTTPHPMKPAVYDRAVPLSGLYNQGVTCYLNTYLQALYGLPYMRKALFYLPITPQPQPQFAQVSPNAWTPLCTHITQQQNHPEVGLEHQVPLSSDLTYVNPTTLRATLLNDSLWVENSIVDKRYTTTVRQHLAQHKKFGKHVYIPGLHEVTPDPSRPMKQFVIQKLFDHVMTPNTYALQNLFFVMQKSALKAYRDIYLQLYNRAMGQFPKSLTSGSDTDYSPNPNSHGICAQATKHVTQSFLSKEFGWRQAQLHEQQDLQELARKVVDNLEKSTYNTIVEGVSQRLFKGYYENVIEAINVDFKKVTEEAYEELILPVKDCVTIADSFNAYQAKDEIAGYRTDHPEFGVQTVTRHQRLTDRLPPVLTLMLKRMDFDYTTFEQTKINSKLEFPPVLDMTPFVHSTVNTKTAALPIDTQVEEFGVDLESYHGALDSFPTQQEAELAKCPSHGDQSLIYDLYSVLVHAGNIHAGHYINFIRPLRSTEHLSATSQPNDNYIVPTNEYQTTDAEMTGLIQGMSSLSTDGTVPQPLHSHGAQCTCNFNHSKAEFYRQGDWYCFDDQQVSLSTAEQAINDNYGNQTNNRFNAGKSAYLLMYIQRKYTYCDTSNSGDDLVFHPVVNSTLGKQLVPASALPENDIAIPFEKINKLVSARETTDVDLDLFTTDENNSTAHSETNATATSAPTSLTASSSTSTEPVTNPRQVFDRFNDEFEQLSSLLASIEAKAHLSKLAALQEIHTQNSGFLNVYAPLPLHRVQAQEKSALFGAERYSLAPPPQAQSLPLLETAQQIDPSDAQPHINDAGAKPEESHNPYAPDTDDLGPVNLNAASEHLAQFGTM